MKTLKLPRKKLRIRQRMERPRMLMDWLILSNDHPCKSSLQIECNLNQNPHAIPQRKKSSIFLIISQGKFSIPRAQKEQREATSQPTGKVGSYTLVASHLQLQEYLGETLLPQRVQAAVTRAIKGHLGLCSCICGQTSQVFLGPPLSQSDFCLRLLPHVACVEMTFKLLSGQWGRGWIRTAAFKPVFFFPFFLNLVFFNC